MARNKHPEQTRNFILETAFRLFIEKGYERTSIQDIIDQLGGLSKGAIYHHFKSKEDILTAVCERMTDESNQLLLDIRDRPGLTGQEKLKLIFRASLDRPVQDQLFTLAPNFSKNPSLLYAVLRETVDDAAPHYILPIIRQGLADGSIATECPEELAELVMLVANIWMNPIMFYSTREQSRRKFILFRQMMQGFGLDIVDDAMLERLLELTALFEKRQ
ncbi:MAG: TetR/AcrR family transcriptional regulator [Oscillospiraceae bacterium]|nr:TetR/AcrR family transcriptional regulator [Oscillospiraceae bacterium]